MLQKEGYLESAGREGGTAAMSSILKRTSAISRMARSARDLKLSSPTYRSSTSFLPYKLWVSTLTGSVAKRSDRDHRNIQSHNGSVPKVAKFSSQPSNALLRDDLPRQPVPELRDTLQKYLRTVKPHVTDEEFSVTEKAVKDFAAPGGLGEKLQKLLKARAASTDSWLAEWWLNLAYLQYRLPLPVWSSPGILLPQQEVSTLDGQLKLAARVIAGILDYKSIIDKRAVPQEWSGKNPMDMSQYYSIFYTCRIPGRTVDKLVHYGDVHPLPTHLVVLRNNHFFHMDVYDKSGEQALSEEQIAEQLWSIVDQSQSPGIPLGVCTMDNRANWGAAYDALRQAKGNKAILGSINSSICVICLDGPNPDMPEHAPDERTVAALEMIHGCGNKSNSGNRWYDKTIQVIIGTKGQLGMAYEHSPAEGPPIANLTDHVMDFVTEKKKAVGKSAMSVHPPKKLDFNIPSSVRDAIETAQQDLDGMVSDLEMTMYTFPHYGKNLIKTFKMSPDSFIQMAIQLAFYRIHGEPAATYESASTRKYLLGRTEAIRSCSMESLEFCKAMMSRAVSINDKVQALKNAVEGHKKYVIEACDGYGVDRHLLGLKQTAIENGMDIHEMFLDPGYTRSSHMRLSTSQVPARYDTVMCFGPLVPDGYGCCYNPRPDSINFGLSACLTSPETHSRKLRDALGESLEDMRDVLSAGSAKL
ncbi:unnamed protein product [Notodromas monacha]|uniref:Choline/carnitine acyltransferase domain-containing protein n=1 Tax=Notodromas monacha TaxID=399045 RepID=A0A7R9BNQ4_9CRUS|nr:unnamed protein product [Notodromas monacha]CAG0917506.1 unnamed protein product [Notodromas monacha]